MTIELPHLPRDLTSAAHYLSWVMCTLRAAQDACRDSIMTEQITVTERAARRISEIAASDPGSPLLRISVEGGGCSGFQYKFDLVSARQNDDLVLEKAGATVLIDPVSVQYMTGAEIDFVDDLIGAAFKINNPIASASCGCGTSFTI
jgi:iron-sulfur cluster assembly accessory protein